MAFGDNLRRKRLSIATWSIAAITCICFGIASLSPVVEQSVIDTFAFVPVLFSIHPALNVYRLVTAEFIHANLIHLAGNLLFLLALGRAVENTVGSIVFASSFVGLGALGFLGSWLIDPSSQVPIVGNSGAISFLLGGYALLFPHAKISLIPFLRWPYLRAWFFAAVWLAFQVFDAATVGETESGVAYWTHFAGFSIGLVAAACWREFAADMERLISEMNKEQP